jgi:hypothetical protein
LLGTAVLGRARPDVAQAHGATFGTAGFSLTTGVLGAGTYDLLVYPRRTGTTTFEGAQAVRVIVK